MRLFAILALCVPMSLASACDGDDHDHDHDAPPADGQATPPAKYSGDPLLGEARASLHAGVMDTQLERRLMDSSEPQHARARRILRFMANEEDRPPPPPKAKAPAAATGAEAGPKPTVSVVAPPKDSPEDPADHTQPGVAKRPSTASKNQGAGASTSSGSTNTGTTTSTSAGAPRLAVLTRMRLSGSASKVSLRLNAADRVVMGMAEQPQSGIVRLVIESAGALPGFLQARPQHEGVKVVDVRRGEDTVQISVELAPGWEARSPRSGADGASIDFVKP